MKKRIIKRKERVIVWAAKGMGLTGRDLKNTLQELLPNKRVLMVRSNSQKFEHRLSDKVINWGNSQYPQEKWHLKHNVLNLPIDLLNDPENVAIAINKLNTFEALQEANVNIPEFTTEKDVANSWLADGDTVLARHTLTGFGGNGISIHGNGVLLGDDRAPLYVKYKKKKHEYRVHVFKGEVLDCSMKMKRKEFDGEINTKIRNLAGGWVYCRGDIPIPEDLFEQAVKAVEAVGLDFGAVDIIWNKKENKSYVLEINTAPGLTGTTLQRYSEAFAKEIQ